jgi:hypothetical protein
MFDADEIDVGEFDANEFVGRVVALLCGVAGELVGAAVCVAAASTLLSEA